MYHFTLWMHIVAIISWMAGILYLYRLFVYHTENRKSQEVHGLLQIMERRLYRAITVPAMSVAYVAGFALVAQNSALAKGGWFHAKLLAVLLLTCSTVYAGKIMRRFAADGTYRPTSRSLRILNEVPTVLMLVIVALVIFRPF